MILYAVYEVMNVIEVEFKLQIDCPGGFPGRDA